MTAADVLRLTNPTMLATGANPVDSITGFRGFSDVDQGGNGDRSCSRTNSAWCPARCSARPTWRRQVFDNKFLLPFAPDPPDFFLIPGDNQVTVIWRPRRPRIGDPFFQMPTRPGIDPLGPARVELAVRPELPAVRRRGLPGLPRAGGRPERADRCWPSSTTPGPSSATSPGW